MLSFAATLAPDNVSGGGGGGITVVHNSLGYRETPAGFHETVPGEEVEILEYR